MVQRVGGSSGDSWYSVRANCPDRVRTACSRAARLIERLAALVPRPRKHLVTYHGILAPAASDRVQVVPQPVEEADTEPQGTTLPTPRRLRPERFSWPQLLQRVFRIDVLRCPCGGRRKVLDFITEPTVIRRILTHLGLSADPRRHAPARPPPQGTFAFT